MRLLNLCLFLLALFTFSDKSFDYMSKKETTNSKEVRNQNYEDKKMNTLKNSKKMHKRFSRKKI